MLHNHQHRKKAKQQEKGEWETGEYLNASNTDLTGFKEIQFVYTMIILFYVSLW